MSEIAFDRERYRIRALLDHPSAAVAGAARDALASVPFFSDGQQTMREVATECLPMAGAGARQDGKPLDYNPYRYSGYSQHLAWEAGWMARDFDLRADG